MTEQARNRPDVGPVGDHCGSGEVPAVMQSQRVGQVGVFEHLLEASGEGARFCFTSGLETIPSPW